MPQRISAKNEKEFLEACAFEHVFGAKIRTAYLAYGENNPEQQCFLCMESGEPAAALYLAHGVLTIAAREGFNPVPLATWPGMAQVKEINTDRATCTALYNTLGGTMDGSYFMVYRGTAEQEPETFTMEPGNLREVFDVLWDSNEYYRAHYTYESWAADQAQKLDKGLVELYQYRQDGRVVGVGSITSEDDECGIVGSISVLPAYQHRGYGRAISCYVTQRVLQKGKTPRLMSAYDSVAELYRQVGFEPCGLWGQMWLPETVGGDAS
jgi:GNAT superfamily N-acetyltransferase